MKINLVMIVKNEERSLGQCLEQAGGLVDEIVIADTGSTDRSVEIARKSVEIWVERRLCGSQEFCPQAFGRGVESDIGCG